MLKLQRTCHIRRIRVRVSNDEDRPQHPQHCMLVNMHKSIQIFGSCNVNVMNYIKQLWTIIVYVLVWITLQQVICFTYFIINLIARLLHTGYS